jgi:futalosine hydrolase
MEKVDLAIVGATPGEITPICGPLKRSGGLEIAGNPFSLCEYRDLKLLIGTTGIGKVNGAAVTAAMLSIFSSGEVWNVGCAGAYEGSGLEIGDVLISESCICADEGILTQDGPMPTSVLKIPLVFKNGGPIYDCFPLDANLAGRNIRSRLSFDGFSGGFVPGGESARGHLHYRIKYGPSLTVSMTSGDLQTAGTRFRRFGGLAENMEGSAIAQSCLLFDVAFLEFRGISNIAGIRDRDRWDMGLAAENCCSVAMHLLDSFRRS